MGLQKLVLTKTKNMRIKLRELSEKENRENLLILGIEFLKVIAYTIGFVISLRLIYKFFIWL